MMIQHFRQLRLLACLAWLSSAVAFPVLAQTAAPAPPLSPEAQAAIGKGILAAKEQAYLLAIRYFQDARKIAPDSAEIYYNLGVAESKLPGRELRAISWYGAYLAATPGAPNAAAVRGEIDRLDIKSEISLYRVIQSAEGTARQLIGNPEEAERVLGPTAGLWAKTGNISNALKVADLFQDDAYYKSLTQVEIAEIQSETGDTAGARKTLASALETANLILHNTGSKNAAWTKIAEAQANAGDVTGAQRTLETAFKATDLLKATDRYEASEKDWQFEKITCAYGQAGDITGVLKGLDRIHDAKTKDRALDFAVRGVAVAGDLAGALKIAGLIQNAAKREEESHWARMSYFVTYPIDPVTKTRTRVHPGAPDVSTTAWLSMLNTTWGGDCPLNTDPFLDVAGYLKSRPPSKTPADVFFMQRDLAETLTKARNVVDSMLKQQARKR